MTLLKRIVWIGALLVSIVAPPSPAFAQTEAIITGVVTDSSGGVLPGVTVTAIHEATGNTFTSVTDERGIYRMQARVGAYQIQMELQGFQSVRRAGHAARRTDREHPCRCSRRRCRKPSPSPPKRRSST